MSKGGRRVRIFSALEVANICGVVNQTAINWIRNGHLKAFTTPGGQYRIYAKDLASFLEKRGMGASGDVLQVMMENANWNTFLISAEPSICEHIMREIGAILPEYSVIYAGDWFETGRKITEEKPGYILLDAELPGADVSGIVQTIKEDPFFGKPFVILLTDGSAQLKGNLSDPRNKYVDAILSKPMDMEKLKASVKGFEQHLTAAITA